MPNPIPMRRRLTWALVLALSTVSLHAGAQPTPAELAASKKAASQLADKAADAFERGKYAQAVEGFQKAEALFHAPTFQLFTARAQVKLGKLAEARATYRSIVDEKLPGYAPAEFFAAQKDAASDLAALEPRVPKLRLHVDPRITTVTVDARTIAAAELVDVVAVDPGDHEIIGRGAGPDEARRTITLKEGDIETVELALAAAAPTATALATAAPGRSGPPGVSIAAFAVGGAGLGVGIAFGVLALGAKADFDKNPTLARADEGEWFTRIADIGFGTALIGAAVGGIVWWRVRVAENVPAKGSPTQTVYLVPRPGGLTIGGAF